MKKHLFLLSVLAVLALVACGSVYEKETVGIGPDYSELKKSPCACLELKRVPKTVSWIS